MYRTNIDKLEAAITKSGRTITEVASALGIDRSTFYRRVEKNNLKVADMQILTVLLGLTGEQACAIFLAQ